MKQILPFVFIAIIVGGVMFFLGDDYEKDTFDPILTEELAGGYYWDVTFFLEEGEEEEEQDYYIGAKLNAKNEDFNIEKIEFTVMSNFDSVFYQDLNVEEDFDGEIIHSKRCQFCTNEVFLEDRYQYVDIVIYWMEDGTVREERLHSELNWSEHFRN